MILFGCAKSAEEVSASYVSPVQYGNYSCAQLRGELMSVNRRLMSKPRAQDSKSESDALVTGVGIVLFWPALFFIDGDDENTGELVDGPDQKSPTCSAENRREPAFSTAPSVGVNPLGRLKGEFDALERAALTQNCDVAQELTQARADQDHYKEEKRKRNQTTE